MGWGVIYESILVRANNAAFPKKQLHINKVYTMGVEQLRWVWRRWMSFFFLWFGQMCDLAQVYIDTHSDTQGLWYLLYLEMSSGWSDYKVLCINTVCTLVHDIGVILLILSTFLFFWKQKIFHFSWIISLSLCVFTESKINMNLSSYRKRNLSKCINGFVF